MGSFNGDFSNDFDAYFEIDDTDTFIGIISSIPFTEQLIASQDATWSVLSGTLPVGISLSATGLVSGTSLDIGTHFVTIRAVSNVGSYIDDVLFDFVVTRGTGGALWRRRSSIRNFRLMRRGM